MIATAGTDVVVPSLDVTSFVFEHASDRLDKAALIEAATGRTLTYADVVRGVGAVAAGLARRGFGPGDVLGLFLANAPEYALAFHGASAAGGKCSPVNPLYTVQELAHQLQASGARWLLTDATFVATAREAAARAGIEEVFVLGGEDDATSFDALLREVGDPPESLVDAAVDLAVLPFSSGTTGLPKGVMLTHRNLVANLAQLQASITIEPQDRLIGVLPFFHIYGMQAVMNQALRAGATVVTMPRFDLVRFLDALERYAITRACVAPPIVLALATSPEVEGRDLSSLETIICGAAPLSGELGQRVEARLGCTVIQGYGMTETSPVTHMVRPRGLNKPGSIGPALPGTESRLVDPQTGEDVGLGARGELWIRGPQVMPGYLDNPGATAEIMDSDGWLHTGDVAIADADGYFWIVDRLKELIKFNGFQVAPAELEALILRHPLVRDVAVIGVPDDNAGELPKAFVVAGDSRFDPDELMQWVAAKVSPQKRIRLVEVIDEIPKSASGKILRRRLKDRT